MTLAGRTFSQPLDVEPDPPSNLTPVDYEAAHRFMAAVEAKFSSVDSALNRLDAVAASAQQRGLTALTERARTLRGERTADYHNDEDSIDAKRASG